MNDFNPMCVTNSKAAYECLLAIKAVLANRMSGNRDVTDQKLLEMVEGALARPVRNVDAYRDMKGLGEAFSRACRSRSGSCRRCPYSANYMGRADDGATCSMRWLLDEYGYNANQGVGGNNVDGNTGLAGVAQPGSPGDPSGRQGTADSGGLGASRRHRSHYELWLERQEQDRRAEGCTEDGEAGEDGDEY